ncbi:putative siderophore transport system ATP-binding protein YusV [Enhygromyxa salina]|uniref:Putative siderophore transport system ATP-binding protein YusV n=1 Tax=Enhygromyxa salina TaxID=215803 RepID=A0A2S9YD39_9BACT|nr:ABC transporter ATP-binding protein [Enhygromyxa salina]PRQ03038.1 putative siderophore transport system ATP-binding protein YusV [Enhygromyxa salina]
MKLRAEQLGLRVAGRWLIRDCSLELSPGSVTVIVGPNGSGKTTLLRALLGLVEPDEGRVLLDDRPLAKHSLRERARVCAWLPQRTELPWGMPAEQLVMLGRAPHLSALAGPGRADEHAVAAALARVSATELAARDVRTLSGGELQRVLLARLLATQAPLLLLDEPTTALDVGHALSLLELARELAASGHGVLMSLHELELARRYGDRALLLRGDADGGHVFGAVAEVLTPALVSEVFDVAAELADGQLRFAASARV